MTNRYTCLVCGWKGLKLKPAFPFGTHEICSCCGTEYGFDVQDENDIPIVRQEWLESGAPWFDDEMDVDPKKPKIWNIDEAKNQIKEGLEQHD